MRASFSWKSVNRSLFRFRQMVSFRMRFPMGVVSFRGLPCSGGLGDRINDLRSPRTDTPCHSSCSIVVLLGCFEAESCSDIAFSSNPQKP